MGQQATDKIVAQMSREVPRSIAVVEFGIAGFSRLAEEVAAHRGSAENPDPNIFIGDQPLEDGAAYAWLRQSDMIEMTHGGVRIALTQQWIVAAFTKWELDYRPRFAAALNLDQERVRSDIYGDLRHLRNDVVHHGGIATDRNAGRCKLLKFKPGSTISLDSGEFSTFIENLIVMAVGDEVG